MDNLFDVNVILPDAVRDLGSLGSSANTFFALRCLGFEPPKFTLKTYDAPYKTMRVKRAGGRIEGERSFRLQFRLDSYYQIYRYLLAWRSAQMQLSSGFAGSSINVLDGNNASFLGSIEVTAVDSPVSQQPGNGYKADGVTEGQLSERQKATSGTSTSLNWIFGGVWVMDVDNPKFITGSGEIQLISATFGFISYMDPQMFDQNNHDSFAGNYNSIIPVQPQNASASSGLASSTPPKETFGPRG